MPKLAPSTGSEVVLVLSILAPLNKVFVEWNQHNTYDSWSAPMRDPSLALLRGAQFRLPSSGRAGKLRRLVYPSSARSLLPN